MTWRMATSGRANIKVGPPSERAYDEVAARYIGPGYGKEAAEAAFGAVPLK